ncbi:MAG TPA: hypothetical protein VME23_03675 [Terracidiphilus sp.]|nr:hypothetical protein [Terracidiphilus sp.]
MEHAAAVQPKPKLTFSGQVSLSNLHDDPYWELAQRVVAGPQFARSPLLSRFLLYVVAETLEGRGDEITEHQIGVQVFDRSPDYRTLEDNIVRSYARQLRKRLAEHFADRGSAEQVRIDIPVGGYVPVFLPMADNSEKKGPEGLSIHGRDAATSGALHVAGDVLSASGWLAAIGRLRMVLLIAAYSTVLVGVTWLVAARVAAPRKSDEPARILWRTIFGGTANSYIVPSDAGFNLLEDLSRQPQPLAQYIAGSYENLPLGGVDAHSAEDLRTQQLTPFVDLQIATALAHLEEDDPQRVLIRFPRDLRLDDLKDANAVIIGSLGSNPWAAMVESSANFRIVYQPGMSGAEIVNQKPQPGEAAVYNSHWNEPSHETFALIDFLPNLSGSGHLLVLEGLDVAGTQAAAEMLLHPSAIDSILKRATLPDGSLRHFEVLLRSTSIESNATGTQVIASRIY